MSEIILTPAIFDLRNRKILWTLSIHQIALRDYWTAPMYCLGCIMNFRLVYFIKQAVGEPIRIVFAFYNVFIRKAFSCSG